MSDAGTLQENDEPVPREIVGALDEQADWQHGTAEAALTDQEGFLAVVSDLKAGLSVAFGHTGHGQASWLCRQLIRGPLAAFVRPRYGSPYDDEIGRLIANNTAEQGEELVLTGDDAGESGCEVVGSGAEWQASETPLAATAAFLEES